MTSQKKASRLPGDADREAALERRREYDRKQAEEKANAPSIEEQVMEQAKEQRQIQGNSVVLDALRKAQAEIPATMPPNVAASGSGEGNKLDLALREFTLEREDNRPLRFHGYLVGWNEIDIQEQPRGTQVQIFVTRSDKIITRVYQWQRKEGLAREKHKAGVHMSPEEALDWLIADGGGKLGRASREAWETACSIWPSLKGYDVEVID
jgi:hypothetical protein